MHTKIIKVLNTVPHLDCHLLRFYLIVFNRQCIKWLVNTEIQFLFKHFTRYEYSKEKSKLIVTKLISLVLMDFYGLPMNIRFAFPLKIYLNI